MLRFSFHLRFKTAHFQLRLPSLPFREPPEMLTFLLIFLCKAAHFQLRLLPLPFPGAGPEQPLKAAWSRQEPRSHQEPPRWGPETQFPLRQNLAQSRACFLGHKIAPRRPVCEENEASGLKFWPSQRVRNRAHFLVENAPREGPVSNRLGRTRKLAQRAHFLAGRPR